MNTNTEFKDAIDFVIPWVDGSDPEWRASMLSYNPDSDSDNTSEARYRDWDLLRYWFRAVEKYAPWVRRIHFVTVGHVPSWLNVNHPKLHIVKHSDYIPEQYLPTFSSHTIELNFHRIDGLADKFVYFNDDMFLNKPVEPEDFFVEGLPKDLAALNIHCYSLSMPIQVIATYDVGVINEHFKFKEVIKKHPFQWFNPKYGTKLLRTLALVGAPRFPGFYIHHCPQNYLKSTFQTVWDLEPEILNRTCLHKFREENDVNQWVMKEWQLASGSFVPQADSFSSLVPLGINDPIKQAELAATTIRKKRVAEFCLNDGDISFDQFKACQSIIQGAFEETLPVSSSFELL